MNGHQHHASMGDSGHSDHNAHGMNHMTGHQGHQMMHGHSTFRFYTTTPMLFQAWPTSTVTGLVLAMLATVAFAFVYEGLRYYVYVHSALEKRGAKCPKSAKKYQLLSRITGSFLHMLHFFTGYVLMLAVMTFNIWIFVALLVGATLGYFFIRPTLENYFKIIRDKRNKCGTKGRKLMNGSANGEVRLLATYNFPVQTNGKGDRAHVKTNGSINGCQNHHQEPNGVIDYGLRETLLQEERVSVV